MAATPRWAVPISQCPLVLVRTVLLTLGWGHFLWVRPDWTRRMVTSSRTTEVAQPEPAWRAQSQIAETHRTRGAISTLVGHQLASVVSGAVDFATMIALVRLCALSPTLATAFGAAVGAVVNFSLGRSVVFTDHTGPVGAQAFRYALVSGMSLVLNALGEYLTTTGLHMQYVVARAFVALSVSLLWNFPLQRHFVFRRESLSAREASH